MSPSDAHSPTPGPSSMRQPGEPLPEDFVGFGGQVRRFWIATRPQFLVASVMPVLVGSAWGASQTGTFDPSMALLFLFAMVFGHAAGNLINDVCDDLSGNDQLNQERIFPFTGGSRVIQLGILGRQAMTRYAAALLVACAALGSVLVWLTDWILVAWGLGMGLLLLAYHLAPFKLNHRGLGEVTIGVMFGIAPVTIAAWLQGGAMDATAVLIATPVALWVANILLINEVPDRRADAQVGKRTLVVILGVANALRLHMAVNLAALIAVTVAAAIGAVSPLVLLVLVPVTALGLAQVRRAYPRTQAAGSAEEAHPSAPTNRARTLPAIQATLMIHTAGSLVLTLALAIDVLAS